MSDIDFDALKAPFHSDRISWRVGSTSKDKSKGLALAYMNARDVMERLDSVCGINGWQAKYSHSGQRVICDLGVKAGDEWIWKANGAGDTQVEADKGAISDAFKRAAVMWGIGRYLYEMPSIWVMLEPAGRSYKIKESQVGKLRAAHDKISGEYIPKNKEARDNYNTLMQDISNFDSLNDLGRWWLSGETQAKVRLLPTDWRTDVERNKDEQKITLSDNQAGFAVREKSTA